MGWRTALLSQIVRHLYADDTYFAWSLLALRLAAGKVNRGGAGGFASLIDESVEVLVAIDQLLDGWRVKS
jgi:hypothetical protein